MAGDWIKVEKATPNKPEVLKMARILGVSRQHAFGLLFEFWAWLDSNCVDGVVDGVVDADVDTAMACEGFSALLRMVGWVEFDADPCRMRVVNFARHNGESSKNRALKSERQKKWRSKSVGGNVDVVASTREEKRREDIKQDQKLEPRARARATLETPSADHVALAMQVGVDCQAEFVRYRDWLAANGKRQRDEGAGFRNWLRRAAEFNRSAGPPKRADERQRVATAIYGGAPDEQRTIDGESQRVA